MERKNFEEMALPYHQSSPKGKIAVNFTKPLDTQDDLSIAYSPGVAGPCRRIAENVDESFNYTVRGNLVGVITNGSAVLGLGNIGPYAGKPVMEGKAMLFKKFADIDVFDIEVAQEDPDKFIEVVKSLEPTFGGINLEDIKAPECFYIEEQLREQMSIPVFHDDQHGTAIIAASAFLNAIELTNRDIAKVRVVFSGAGAAAIACAGLLRKLGVSADNMMMCDSKGVLHQDRGDLNPYKARFVSKGSAKTLAEALVDADAFIGVSSADILTPDMLQSMNKNPIVFALANPNPEIKPELAWETRKDAIIATGRSDYPNQVNNVLGFPYIFRGALDVRATTINDEMKLAAVRAIAGLAKEAVPEEVMAVYRKSDTYQFGRDYLIPKPVDQRVLLRVAPAVAKAAMDSGVARVQIDMDQYREQIHRLLGTNRMLIRRLRKDISASFKERGRRPKIVLPAGDNPRVLRAAKQVHDDGEVEVCLLGDPQAIQDQAQTLGIGSLEGLQMMDPASDSRRESYANFLYDLRKRKGLSIEGAKQLVASGDYFAATMVRSGDADGMINGVVGSYRDAVKPILETVGTGKDHVLAGVYQVSKGSRTTFFADCTINVDPTAEEIADIAVSTAELAKQYTDQPVRVALLSFSNFGSSPHPSARKVAKALSILQAKAPELECEGEMQADVALNREIREREFPFAQLNGEANVLIFPDVGSANIAYKLLCQIGEVDLLGPILVGLRQPAYAVQRSATVSEIVNMIYVSAHHGLR